MYGLEGWGCVSGLGLEISGCVEPGLNGILAITWGCYTLSPKSPATVQHGAPHYISMYTYEARNKFWYL